MVYEAHAGPIVGIIMHESDFENHEENRVRMLLWSCHCFGGVTSSVLMKISPVVKMGKDSVVVCSILGVCITVPSCDSSRSVSGVGGLGVTIPAWVETSGGLLIDSVSEGVALGDAILLSFGFEGEIWAVFVAGRWPGEGGLSASPVCCEEDTEAAENNPGESASESDGGVRDFEFSIVFSDVMPCELVEFVAEIVEACRLRACAGDRERSRLSITILWEAEM